jgi:hypothetical protein
VLINWEIYVEKLSPKLGPGVVKAARSAKFLSTHFDIEFKQTGTKIAMKLRRGLGLRGRKFHLLRQVG